LHAWTASTAKAILSPLLIYGVVFLVVPLILTKGFTTILEPPVLIPLILAVGAIGLWFVFRGIATVAFLILAYLHWRFDLSELGFRSRGWRGDLIAIVGGPLNLGNRFNLRSTVYSRTQSLPLRISSTSAERLAAKTGRWLTPLLIALMYTAHEMSNPQYWYKGMNFGFVFVGVALITALYLWRRNVVAIWLGDGVRWFLTGLV